MDVIQPPRSSPAAPERGWWRLGSDLRSLDGRGAVDARRRGVALRLLAAGLPPELLEAVLPGWGRYLEAERVGIGTVA